MCTINSTATAKNIKQRVIINKPMVRKMQSYKNSPFIQKKARKKGKGDKGDIG